MTRLHPIKSLSVFILSVVITFQPAFANKGKTLVEGLELGIGYHINFITSIYESYEGTPDYIAAYQAFDIKYSHVNLLDFRLVWRNVIRYEKTYPLGKTSKKVFSLWEKSYYERDLFNLNLYLLQTFGKKGKDVPVDLFIGYKFDKEVYNTKLDVNQVAFDAGYKVYYAEVDNGVPTNIEELKNTKSYSLLQDFNLQHIYIGSKIAFFKTWLGYCKVKTKQPITWWVDNLFGSSAAVIVRSDIKSEGLCGGFGFVNKLGKKLYIHIPKLIELGPLYGKTKWTTVKNGSLSPDYIFKSEAGPMLYVSNETNLGLELEHFAFNIKYDPYIFIITGKDPFFVDPMRTITNIVHRFSFTISYKF